MDVQVVEWWMLFANSALFLLFFYPPQIWICEIKAFWGGCEWPKGSMCACHKMVVSDILHVLFLTPGDLQTTDYIDGYP